MPGSTWRATDRVARRSEMLGKLRAGALTLGREGELGLFARREAAAALEREQSGHHLHSLQPKVHAIRRRKDERAHGAGRAGEGARFGPRRLVPMVEHQAKPPRGWRLRSICTLQERPRREIRARNCERLVRQTPSTPPRGVSAKYSPSLRGHTGAEHTLASERSSARTARKLRPALRASAARSIGKERLSSPPHAIQPPMPTARGFPATRTTRP